MIKKIYFYVFLFFCLILNIVLDINIKNYINLLNICFEKDIIVTGNLYVFICFIIALISIFIIIDIYLYYFKNKTKIKALISKQKMELMELPIG